MVDQNKELDRIAKEADEQARYEHELFAARDQVGSGMTNADVMEALERRAKGGDS